MTREGVNRKLLTRRDFLRGSIGLVGLATLAGCGSATTPTVAPTATPAPTPSGPVTLNFITPLPNVDLRNVLEWIIDRWHETNKTIKVVPNWTDAQSIPEKAFTLFDSGDTSVDLAVMGFENIPAFIGAGYAAPLGIPDINEFAEEQVKIVTRENKVYAVPWFVSVMGYYYNKKLFREAGLDPENPPRTLDELVEQSTKMTKGDVFGLTYCALKDWGQPTAEWLCLLYALGGYPMTENTDAGQPTLNTPQAIKALQMWLDWRDRYKIVPPDVAARNVNTNSTAFSKGRVGGWTTWYVPLESSLVEDMLSEDVAFDLPPYFNPDTNKTGSWSGGWAAMVPALSKKRAAAQEFVRFLTGPEAQKRLALEIGRCSRNSTFQDPEVLAKWPHLQKVGEIIPYAHVRPTIKQWPGMNEAIMDAIGAVLNENVSPEDALKTAQEKVEAMWAAG